MSVSFGVLGVNYRDCCEHQTGKPAREENCLVKAVRYLYISLASFMLWGTAYIIQTQLSCMSTETQPASHPKYDCRSREPDARVYWHPCYSFRVFVVCWWPFCDVCRCEVSNIAHSLRRASHIAVDLKDQYSRRLELLVSEQKDR